MAEKTSTISFKLSPGATAAVLAMLLVAGGVIYKVKPEWIQPFVAFGSSGSTLTQEKYYPEIEENLAIYLKGAVIRQLAETGAPQSAYNAARDVTITGIQADPIGYYRREMDFWMANDHRRVELFIHFTCGGQAYQAEGEMTVSGRANNISLSDVQLVSSTP